MLKKQWYEDIFSFYFVFLLLNILFACQQASTPTLALLLVSTPVQSIISRFLGPVYKTDAIHTGGSRIILPFELRSPQSPKYYAWRHISPPPPPPLDNDSYFYSNFWEKLVYIGSLCVYFCTVVGAATFNTLFLLVKGQILRSKFTILWIKK